jgi:hypothetical protein
MKSSTWAGVKLQRYLNEVRKFRHRSEVDGPSMSGRPDLPAGVDILGAGETELTFSLLVLLDRELAAAEEAANTGGRRWVSTELTAAIIPNQRRGPTDRHKDDDREERVGRRAGGYTTGRVRQSWSDLDVVCDMGV